MSVSVPASTMATELKTRNDIHLARKLWHLLAILTILVIFHLVSRALALQLLLIFGSLVLFLDLLRQRVVWLNRLTLKLVGPLMRDTEAQHLSGATYGFLGIFISVALFPPDIVKLSLLFLAVADPLASYVGIRYGKDKLFGKKSLQGSTAAFVACCLISAIFFVAQGLMVERLLMASILSGLVGALAEAMPVGKLDDNLVMPVVSSSLLMLIFSLFGGL